MNPIAIGYAIQLLTQLPVLIMAGQEVLGLITKGADALKDMQLTGRDPTDAEWQELNDSIEALGQRLHADSK